MLRSRALRTRIALEAGAAVDQTEEDGWSALMLAAQNGHEQCARTVARLPTFALKGHLMRWDRY